MSKTLLKLLTFAFCSKDKEREAFLSAFVYHAAEADESFLAELYQKCRVFYGDLSE